HPTDPHRSGTGGRCGTVAHLRLGGAAGVGARVRGDADLAVHRRMERLPLRGVSHRTQQLAGDGAAEQRGRIDGGALQPTDGGGGAGITADPDHLLGPGPVLHARSDGRRTEGLRTQGDSCAREAGHTGWFLCARPHGPSCVCLVRSGWINTQTSPSGTCPACARPTTGPRSCLARFWENSAGPCPTWGCTTVLGQ